MSEAMIRSDLQALVATVTAIGVVHDYERFASKWEVYLDLFKTVVDGQDRIRGWTVGYAGFAGEQAEFGGSVFRAHRFKVRGYLGVEDQVESEKDAAELAEDVCNTLDDSATLHDGQTYHYASPANIDTFEMRKFGSVLCHYAEISVEVTEYLP